MKMMKIPMMTWRCAAHQSLLDSRGKVHNSPFDLSLSFCPLGLQVRKFLLCLL